MAVMTEKMSQQVHPVHSDNSEKPYRSRQNEIKGCQAPKTYGKVQGDIGDGNSSWEGGVSSVPPHVAVNDEQGWCIGLKLKQHFNKFKVQ